MRDKRTVDELSIEELEVVLAIKKREARQARLRSLAQQGRLVGVSPEDNRQPTPQPQLHELVADVPAPDRPNTFDTTVDVPRWEDAPPEPSKPPKPHKPVRKPAQKNETVRPLAERREAVRQRQRRDKILLSIEVSALVAFLILIGGTVLYMRGLIERTNRELAVVDGPTPTVAPEIDLAIVLPGGHMPPTPFEEERPNWQEIPEHLRPVVQARLEAPVTVPTPSESSPVRVRIPAAGVDHSVVMGDDWEALRRGVGHRLGSANPGMRGNMVLAAHNDIYGEIFRRLDQLEAGDEVLVYTMTQEYRYIVSESRVVSPTEVWVLQPTQGPTLTLISCYPYMVDNQRIVVFADLAE